MMNDPLFSTIGQHQGSATVYFGTVTGNAECCAEVLVSTLALRGRSWDLCNLDSTPAASLTKNATALFVVSTWGDGEPPDGTIDFWSDLQALPDGTLTGLCYSVIALGDSSYEIFCGFGLNLDRELARLGAARMMEPLLCDGDWEEPLRGWIPGVMAWIEHSEPVL